MKKKRLLLCALLLALMLSTTARADMGPKPSVNVTFTGLEEGPCYATLLSEQKVSGPFHAWVGGTPDSGWVPENEENNLVWQAFGAYKDPDGFYFLEYYRRVDTTGRFAWTYYPPSTYKILLYYPESGEFVSSGILDRYAFDSYYTVDAAENPLLPERSYEYGWEIVSLLVRIVLTIAVELGLALLCGLRRRWQVRTVVLVNVITQVALNVALNIINYKAGSMAFVMFYVLLEILVFIVEGVAFSILLRRRAPEGEKMGHPVVYAFWANVFSFAVGYALAHWIPGIF